LDIDFIVIYHHLLVFVKIHRPISARNL